MTDWPEIFFARHGETDWNREKRYQGTIDIPLNETGRGQADATGPLLKKMLAEHDVDPTDIEWYASPLSRASETMARMRKAFDIELPEVIFDDRLREISFGTMEGKLHSEVSPMAALAPGERRANYWFHRPPEGESYQDIAERLLVFKEQLGGPSIIVAHGGILRALRHLAEGAPHEDVVNWPPPQGAIAHFVNGEMQMHYAEM